MNPTPLPADHPERVAMELLRDLGAASVNAIKSLSGQLPKSLISEYFYYSARQITEAATGFWVLRGRGLRVSARMLVRPAIEAVFRVNAVKKKPELIYRIFYGEASELDKWTRRMLQFRGIEAPTTFKSPEWQIIREGCVKAFGEDKLKDAPMTLRDLAREAGMEEVYYVFYAMYCKHTHGSLPALQGQLDFLSDPADTWVMVMSSMEALDALVVWVGGDCPDLERLRERWKPVAFGLKQLATNPDTTPNAQSQRSD
jgi:Family of unknown function (DUF5677)